MTSKPHFPPSPNPRTWLITAATSPIGISIARAALAHGDSVVAGIGYGELEIDANDSGGAERGEEFREFMTEEVVREGWGERIREVGLDGRCEGPPIIEECLRREGDGRLMYEMCV